MSKNNSWKFYLNQPITEHIASSSLVFDSCGLFAEDSNFRIAIKPTLSICRVIDGKVVVIYSLYQTNNVPFSVVNSSKYLMRSNDISDTINGEKIC